MITSLQTKHISDIYMYILLSTF